MSTLRGVFEGADDEVRYIAANEKLKQAGWADGRTHGRTHGGIKGFQGAPWRELASWQVLGVINKSLRALATQGCKRILQYIHPSPPIHRRAGTCTPSRHPTLTNEDLHPAPPYINIRAWAPGLHLEFMTLCAPCTHLVRGADWEHLYNPIPQYQPLAIDLSMAGKSINPRYLFWVLGFI